MAREALRLVLDTNALLRGLARPSSASGRILAGCESRRAVVLLSRPVMSEYRRVLNTAAEHARPAAIRRRDIELVLRRLQFVGDHLRRVGTRFELARHPTDAKFIELSIAGNATHLITHDADLLSLSTAHSEASKRLRQRCPRLVICDAGDFIEAHSNLFES